MTEVRVPPLIHVAPDLISQSGGNPNMMDADEYTRLKNTIKTVGFLQPLLVRQEGGLEWKDGDVIESSDDLGVEADAQDVEQALADRRFVLVDGEHRLQAGIELGMETIPCVIVDEGDDVGRALRIGMNRIRGQLDLTAVSRELDELMREEGWTAADLEVTGFDDDEIRSLLKSAVVTDPVLDAINEAGNPDEPVMEDEKPRGFTIRLVFDSEAERIRVKSALLTAAGEGGSMAEGMLALIGQRNDDE